MRKTEIFSFNFMLTLDQINYILSFTELNSRGCEEVQASSIIVRVLKWRIVTKPLVVENNELCSEFMLILQEVCLFAT